MKVIKVIAIAVILLLGIFIALSPGIFYAPVPRIVLFFLISLLPALLLGAEASSKFQLKLGGFIFTTAGACAVCFGALVLLTHLSKPEEKLAVFQIYDEQNEPIPLDWPNAITVPITNQGLTVTKFVAGNSVVLVFPEQVTVAELRVKKSPAGRTYTGEVTYTGTRISKITLGQQLK